MDMTGGEQIRVTFQDCVENN